MSRIFLSHSSKDLFEAIAVRDWLATEGWDDVFLDVDPERGINPGERWERALHQAAQRCEAVVFLLSRAWLASGWCRKEYELAHSLKKQLFGVLIDPAVAIEAAAPELIGTWQIVSLVPGQDGRVFAAVRPGSHEERHVTFGADGLRRLKRGLEKAGLDPKFFAWPPEGEPGRAPFRGLKPLEAEDAGIFFGRDAPIVEAIDRLRNLAAAAPPRLLVILGASGAGKSSFLRAGLLPRLKRDDEHFLPLSPIRPERAAITGEHGLVRALEAALPGRSRAEWKKLVGAGATAIKPLLAGLAQAAFQRTLAEEQAAKPPAIVIAIDQAEELFRPDGAEEGLALLAFLRELTAGDDPAVVVVFAIRSDSYDALEHAKPLEGLQQATLPLLPMPRSAYKEVIEGPARRLADRGGRLVIEPQLTARLLADIEKGGGSDALPLLAFTLEQLFLEYGGDGTLPLADYVAFGGLQGAIDAKVAYAFARADADPRIPRARAEREALLRRGFVPWLAGIDPVSKSPRRNIARARDIPAEAAPLIDLLVEVRLLSTDTKPEKDPATGEEVRVKTIEPAHEALLRQWSLLQGWLTEDFGLLATLEAVNRASRDWDANARDDAWLAHQGQRLADAATLDARPDIAAKLDAVDRRYLAACRAREETARREVEERRREKEAEEARKLADAEAIAAAQRRIAGRTRVGLAVALLLAMVAGVFGVYAQHQRSVARTAESLAERHADEAQRDLSGALAALSQVAVRDSPARAAKLALASWPRDASDRKTPKLDIALAALSAAVSNLRERKIFRGHQDRVTSAVFSPDDTRILTASVDKTARVWDAATGRTLAVLEGQQGIVRAATFSPDGHRIAASCGNSSAVCLWDAGTGTPVAVLRGQEIFPRAAFSRDSSRLVTALDHHVAHLWNATTGQQIAVLRGHEDFVRSAAFSSDGRLVVTASDDTTARVWDGVTGNPIAVLNGHKNIVMNAVFSKDGSRIATASGDHTAILWDATTTKPTIVLRGHKEMVQTIEFSADGGRVLTTSSDATARLWDAVTGNTIAILRGNGFDQTVAFSPDGVRIVITSGGGKTASLWDAATGKLITVLRGHDDTVDSAVFSADGTRVVTASWDRTARLWDVAVGIPTAILRGHEGEVSSGWFSRDNARIVTSGDSTTRLWDAATGKTVAVLRDHDSPVNSAVFSPDGARVVTALEDMSAQIWNVATQKPVAVLRGHENGIESAAFSPDGTRVVTASADATARIWDAVSGKQIAVLKGDDEWMARAAYSADGARVVTMSRDGTWRVWDAVTARQVATVPGDQNPSVAVLPDGTRVVPAAQGMKAQPWDAAIGKALAVLRTREQVTYANFSFDGTRAVTVPLDEKIVQLRDAATAKPIAILRGHDERVRNLAFSPDGTRVVTVSEDKTARVWDISTIPKGNIFQIACAWLPDTDLTDIAKEYGLTNLEPICRGDPPLPDPPRQ